MNELKIFENTEFGKMRVIEKNGEPWFVGKDVCESFGDTNYRRSLSTIDENDKGVSQIMTPGGMQNMTIISETGLYDLLFSMQPQKARGVSQNEQAINERIEKLSRFKRWVTHEVLPAIRKHGGYIAGQENMSDEELIARALMVAKHKIEERDKQIEVLKPKALFADAVSASKTSILIGDLAKLIKQNGHDIGQRRLFQWMRDKGYLIKQQGASWNMPTQKSMDMGLFEIKETTITHSDGHISISKTVKVSGKGQVYFVNKFIAN